MKRFARWFLVVAAAVFASAALAQQPEPRSRAIFAQPELDQMLAPIALYPDSLLSQILIAASYPRDVFEAASWSHHNRSLRGDDAVRAVEGRPWDPSVISLVAFPEVLEMMDERREWTERLGMAFLDQADDVMGTIQDLRRRADDAGNLRSSEELRVYREGGDYLIEPPSPEVVYVPYYDPHVVYGAWWWPDYSPVYWRPWAGYHWRAGYSGFGWGYGIHLGPSFFFGAFDWPRRYVRYSSHRPWYYRNSDWRAGHRWSHRGDYRRTGERVRDGDRRWDRNADRTGDRRTGERREWRDGEGRRNPADRRGATVPPSVASVKEASSTQGFFRAPTPRTAVAPTAPATAEPGQSRIERRAPTYAPREAVRQEPRMREEQPLTRLARPAQQLRVAPAGTVQHYAPSAQRMAPQSAPVERAAPMPQAAPPRNPVERSAPRAAPAAREQRESREQREQRDSSSDSPPARGNGISRGRDR